MNSNNSIAVEVRQLEKKFGSFVAVNRVSFHVPTGRIFGFLGPNGAGKSTTIRMLCGILSPTSGNGTVGGFDIRTQQSSIRQNIGYMSQKFSLYEDLTVEENINFYSGIYRIPLKNKKERKDWIIKTAGLESFKSTLTKNLSTGWKQRLAFGCSIIHQPPIIFLDEPTSGVDPIARTNFWNMIKEMAAGGTTVFVTTHYMDEAENCDSLAMIYRGSIIAMGTPPELKTTFMEDSCLDIVLPDSTDWVNKLLSISNIKQTALFGRDIHAIVSDPSSAIPAVEKLLAKENISDYKITRIQPSLEDVFVSLIEKYDKQVQ